MQIRPIPTQEAGPIACVASRNQPAGRALVIGALPPLINAAAAHASAMVHLLRQADYAVTTATGPGLALARHQINFGSESKFRASCGFLSDNPAPDHAIVYVKVFDFARIAKPKWYKRRLEEIRRIRFLTRVIRSSAGTTLVLENTPLLSRYQITQWLVARAVAGVMRKPLRVVSRKRRADKVLKQICGAVLPMPEPHVAEESAYAEAFDPGKDAPRIRLTTFRAEQALDYWCNRLGHDETAALRRDVAELIAVAKRHDFRELPQFRLLTARPNDSALDHRSGVITERLARAQDLHAISDRIGVPISEYMMHLRAAACLEDRFPLANRADGRRFLAWYLQEAAELTPDNWVPVPAASRRFFLTTAKGAILHDLPTDPAVAHTFGRDARPFALSSVLSAYYAASAAAQDRYAIDDPVDRIGFVLSVLFTLPDDAPMRKIAGGAVDYLTEPLGGDGFNVTRLEFLLALQARFEMDAQEAVEQPWVNATVRRWARHALATGFPALLPLARPANAVTDVVPRAELTGLPRSETGVGSNLHMSRLALRQAGIVPKIRDFADGLQEMHRPDTQAPRCRLKRSFALHHINADRIPQTLLSPELSGGKQPYNIGFLLWEFTDLPEAHRLALRMLDEIWTPSRFLRHAYSKATEIPVRNMLKGLHIPQVPPFDLGRIGIPKGAKTFLSCFDFHSSVARKNPLAAVIAFQNAFPIGRDDVRLIIKTTPIVENHWGDPERQMDRIRTRAARDPRIVIIAEYMPFEDLLALIAAVDCLVSPHRAEGFGLMPAYALGLETAVIATDYSGTTDFCTPDTAHVVPCAMTDISTAQALYPMKNAQWAEIDIDALTGAMGDIIAAPDLAAARTRAGHDLIRTRYTTARQSVRYRRRLQEIGLI